MDKVKSLIIEMLEATKKAYDEMVKEGKGYYHEGRCLATIELMSLLVAIYTSLENNKSEPEKKVQ